MLRIIVDEKYPNTRQLQRMVEILRRGGIVVYPTDTVYGIGCDITHKKTIDKIKQIKGKKNKHPLSFICPDLKDIARYAVVSNNAYRIMRRILPGPYTLVLPASREVPRIMMSKKVTVGIRIPDHAVPLFLTRELGNPIITTSVPLTSDDGFHNPEDIAREFPFIDGIIDCGLISPQPSTVLDFSDPVARLIRLGKGPVDDLELED